MPQHRQHQKVKRVCNNSSVADQIKAAKENTKDKNLFYKIVQKHNTKKMLLNQQFKSVFQNSGIHREHYHGGKFNEIFLGKDDNPGFMHSIIFFATSEEMITKKCNRYSRLLGLLDTILSSV